MTAHLLWCPSVLAQLADAERIVALRQTYTSVVSNQIAVIVVGDRKIESAQKKNLPGSGFQQIGTANDFRDLHRGIVDDNRQLIGGYIVAPPHDEVAKIATRAHPLRTEVKVSKANFFSIGDKKSPVYSTRTLVFARPCGDGRLRRPAMPDANGAKPASPRIHRFVIAVVRSARGLRYILPRASTGIDLSRVPQLIPRFQIMGTPFALRIGSKRPSTIGSFTP